MKKILIFLLSFALVSIAIEALLKAARITPPTLKYYNPVYGSLNRPNIPYFKSVEGLYIGNTNYDGRFRENYPKRKVDKKTLRILLVGDSFVEGIDVFSHNHFATYMEKILSEKLKQPVEIINFGRGNCVLQSSSYYFQNYIAQNYDADIVLYFTEGRDIFYSSEKVYYPSTSYILDSNNNLVASYNWEKSPEHLLHKKLLNNFLLKYYESSAYFRLFYRAWARIRISGIPLMTFGKLIGSPPEQYYGSHEFKDSVSLFTQKIYDTIEHYSNGQVIFVLRNKPISAPSIMEYMNLKKYKYINLSDTFADFNIKNTNINAYYFKGSQSYGGHWNNDGHNAVGAFLANRIEKEMNSYNLPNYNK